MSKLVETRNKLIKEIALLGYDDFNKKPGRNMWSTAEVCLHLVLTEKASTEAIVHGLKKTDNKNAERKNTNLLLDRSIKAEAPEIVQPYTEPVRVNQVIDLLNESRNKLLTLLKSVKDKSILTKKTVKHPFFGDLPLDQWVEALYLHEQRHIEQIEEIKIKIGAGK